MALSFNGKEVKKVKFNNSDVNYVIKDGKLVWANSNLWLQGDGASYIDTSIYGFNTTDYELCWKQTGSVNYYGVLCSRKSTSEDRLTIIVGAPDQSDKYLYVSNYSGYMPYQTTYSDLTAYQKRILTKNGGTLTLNGVDKTIRTDKEYQTPTTLKLYVVDTNGTLSNFFIGNIYYTKIYNNTLVRHLVPVPTGLKIGDYTVPSNGMWDIVTQQFFGNSGTGEFSYGKDE